ncbi:hypothetical protein [Endozoicomonas sp.]|uniref:hypothetical protein n=1 Tax=Endozoicomonas sp. TaxID=1892382 RepID=UPI0028881952|nr:hypothetical protein [Endozoicomonas sp.]
MKSLQAGNHLWTDPRLTKYEKLTKAPESIETSQVGSSSRKVDSHKDIETTVYNKACITKKKCILLTPSQVRAIQTESRLTPQYPISREHKAGEAESFAKHPLPLTPSVEATPINENKCVDTRIKPVSYAEKLKKVSTRKNLDPDIARSNDQKKIKERLCNHQNIIRIQAALQSNCLIPPEAPRALEKGFIEQIALYHKNLEIQLDKIKDPIERCLRVTACIEHLHHKLDCKNNSTHFKKLRLSFESIYEDTLHPCITAIRTQASPGYAKEYFEVLQQSIIYFNYYPYHRSDDSNEIRHEIQLTLTGIIESELEYLQFTLSFPQRGDNRWAINRIKWTLGEGGPAWKFEFIDNMKRKKYLQRVESLEKSLSQTDSVNYNFGHKVDFLIASGDLNPASDILADHQGRDPFQERLLCQILKSEFDKVLPEHHPEKSVEQELALLRALYIFRKTYHPFISNNHLLLKDTQSLLSAVTVRILTIHEEKINNHKKKPEIEKIINELVHNKTVSDQCISLWRNFRNDIVDIEDSLAGMTSHDAFELFKKTLKKLEARSASNDDFQSAAREIKRWAINDKALQAMDKGDDLIKILRTLKQKLYIHYFHKIFQDGKPQAKYTPSDYNRMSERMNQHRENCIRNQELLYLLKDDQQRNNWRLNACKAWGKTIRSIRNKIHHSQVICEREIDQLLQLNSISPNVEFGLTRVDLKKLTIDIFKSAVQAPHLVQVSHEKLQALSNWVLAILNTGKQNISVVMGRDSEIRESISTYRAHLRQKTLKEPQPLPFVPSTPEPFNSTQITKIEHSPQKQDCQATVHSTEISTGTTSESLPCPSQRKLEIKIVDKPNSQDQKNLNLHLVTEILIEKVGSPDAVMQTIDLRAEEMGVTRKSLQLQAENAPSIFKKLMGLDTSSIFNDILSKNRPFNFIQSSITDEDTEIPPTQNTGSKPVLYACHEEQQTSKKGSLNNAPILNSVSVHPERHSTSLRMNGRRMPDTIYRSEVHALESSAGSEFSTQDEWGFESRKNGHHSHRLMVQSPLTAKIPDHQQWMKPLEYPSTALHHRKYGSYSGTTPGALSHNQDTTIQPSTMTYQMTDSLTQAIQCPKRKPEGTGIGSAQVIAFRESQDLFYSSNPIVTAPPITEHFTHPQVVQHERTYHTSTNIFTRPTLIAPQEPETLEFSGIPFNTPTSSDYLYVHRTYDEALLVYLPYFNTDQPDDHYLLKQNLGRIDTILQNLHHRLQGDIRYRLVDKNQIKHIDLCIEALSPWFKQFCHFDQEIYEHLKNALKKLTQPSEDGKIDQIITSLIKNQIRQGNIYDATQIICLQQGLYHLREVLGLSVNYSSYNQ